MDFFGVPCFELEEDDSRPYLRIIVAINIIYPELTSNEIPGEDS
jgi:hypothetical protein